MSTISCYHIMLRVSYHAIITCFAWMAADEMIWYDILDVLARLGYFVWPIIISVCSTHHNHSNQQWHRFLTDTTSSARHRGKRLSFAGVKVAAIKKKIP